MKPRSQQILAAIVQSFISEPTPVSSKHLQTDGDFDCSPATIRNEMSALESAGYLHAPHTSAGRVPTEKGWQYFVANCRDDWGTLRPQLAQEFVAKMQQHQRDKQLDETVFDAISVLTKMTDNVAFATVPSSERTFFLGLSNIIRKPEFASDAQLASGVFRVLEDGFATTINALDLPNGKTEILIGSENLLPEIQSCSLLVCQMPHGNGIVHFGVLGPMRMDYGRNIAAIDLVREYLAAQRLG